MRASRAVVEQALASGQQVYGFSTGVGMRKRFAIEEEQARFNRQLVRGHLVAQGQSAPADGVRATMVKLANGLAQGYPGVRPELAQLVVDRLNEGATPRVRMLGSVGQADLAPNADLVEGLLDDFELAAGEALVLVDNNAFSTGLAALAVADCETLLDALDVAGALDLEAFAANPGLVDEAVADARPHPGLRSTIARLRALLEGSYLWEAPTAKPPGSADVSHAPAGERRHPRRARLRQGRSHGGAERPPGQPHGRGVRRAGRRGGELRHRPPRGGARLPADRSCPGVDERSRARAEDVAVAAHRPAGGARRRGRTSPSPGSSELGAAVQGIVAEARLLAQPVSFELASTTQHEGIEDRTTMAPLGARRLAEMVSLGARVVAIELDDCSSGRRSARISRPRRRNGSCLRSSSASSFPSRTPGRPCPPTSSRSSSWFVLT